MKSEEDGGGGDKGDDNQQRVSSEDGQSSTTLLQVTTTTTTTSCTNRRQLLTRSIAIERPTSVSSTCPSPEPGTTATSQVGQVDNDGDDDSTITTKQQQFEQFLVQTLRKNTKDRHLMLRIEADLNQMLRDPTSTQLTFPSMSSYQRMLVHRLASYYRLDHQLDSPTTVCVIRSSNAKIPKMNLKELEVKYASSFGTDWTHNMKDGCAKSLFKVESFDSTLLRRQQQSKPFVGIKSYSFGGYGGKQLSVCSISPGSSGYRSISFEMGVGDCGSGGGGLLCSSPTPNTTLPQVGVTTAAGATTAGVTTAEAAGATTAGLTTAAAGATTTGVTTAANPQSTNEGEIIYWAAITNMSQIPIGAVLIEAVSGQLLRNQDGTLYQYNPDNPPLSQQQSSQQQYYIYPSSGSTKMYPSIDHHGYMMQQQPIIQVPLQQTPTYYPWQQQMHAAAAQQYMYQVPVPQQQHQHQQQVVLQQQLQPQQPFMYYTIPHQHQLQGMQMQQLPYFQSNNSSQQVFKSRKY